MTLSRTALTALCGLVLLHPCGAAAHAQPEEGAILSLLTGPPRSPARLRPGSRLLDTSPALNHARVHGRPQWLSGPTPALRLVPGAYLEVPASDALRGLRALTVSGWFCPAARPTNWPILFGRWDHPARRSFYLYPNDRGLMEWGVGWTPQEYHILRDGCPLSPGRWTHLAATWEAATGELRLYSDGVFVKADRTPAGVTLLDSDVPLLIGTAYNTPGGSGSFNGDISRLRVWNRPLGAEEIRRLQRQEAPDYREVAPPVGSREPRLAANSEKQLLFDDTIIAEREGVRITMNRPQRRGGPCVVADRPWEKALNCFGVVLLQEDGQCRMYYSAWNDQGYPFCLATSRDGVQWEKPALDIAPFGAHARTNILYPDPNYQPLPGYFFGTCVFRDTSPQCRPDERYKMINGDGPTYVWSSPDGLHFRRMFDQPSFRPADTNNVAFFDNRLGRYVAYVRSYDGLRVVGRCEFDDLASFGQDTIVLACDDQDQAALDKSRYTDVSFYNSSAIRYPYAAHAYLAFPSALYHTPEPPAGRLPNDGITDIQLAVSRDGIAWSRPSRQAFMPLRPGENGLYMGTGLVRQGNELSLYYGVYHNTHGDALNVRDYIARAVIRLDGFVSADAAGHGTLTTVPLTFTGSHLELNVQGAEVRAALLDRGGRPLPGFSLDDCDAITGDHIAQRVTWHGRSDLRKLAGRTVRLRLALHHAKLYAFQFAPAPNAPPPAP